MKILICGGAKCVWDDLERAFALFTPDLTIAINDIVMFLPRVDHFCSMHPNKVPRWLAERQSKGFDDPVLWTARHKKIKNLLEFQLISSNGGGSGMLAVRVARKLGGTKIVLAGIPMEAKQAHFFTTKNWHECHVYQRFWRKSLPYLKQDVRSLSGWTRENIGAPTKKWLVG